MSLFKSALDYLTGKKQLQEQLNQLEKKVENISKDEETVKEYPEPICKNRTIYNVNTKSITVIDCEGNTFDGYVEADVIEKLKQADTAEIIKLLTPEVIEEENTYNVEQEEKEIVKPFLNIFDNVNDFEVVGDNLYFKGIKSVAIPSLIVARFVELLEQHNNNCFKLSEFEEYQSLKAFTLKLLTSPRQESINQVLDFCRHNNLRISKRGNIIGYRRVKEFTDVQMPENTELTQFVKESVEKLKKWKKGVKNYFVYLSYGEFLLAEQSKWNETDNIVGNLYELYNNQSVLTSETTKLYTSQHSYGKYTFVIGDIYKADEDDIDVDAGQCHSGGLHFASVDYNYSGYGEIPVVVLINPAKTITIPLNEIRKGRTTEMKIACINPNEHGVHIQEELIEKADEEYDEFVMEELLQAVANKTVVNLSVEEEVTQLSIPEIKNVTELLRNRIVTI